MCGTALIILLLTSTAKGAVVAKGAMQSKSTGGQTITIPLQKQMVPVKRNNETVSYKSAYFGTIQLGVGGHQQELSVTFDTASGQVIVPSARCNSKPCLLHRRYDISQSPTGKDIDADGSRVSPDAERDEVTVGFGTGEVSGDFASETICMSGERISGTSTVHCVKDVHMVMAIEMSDEPFQSVAFDGVLGLGLPALSLTPEFSFFGAMVATGQIAAPQFALSLAGNDNDISEISFGGYNAARMRTQPRWVSVAAPELGYWQLNVKEIRVDGKVLDFCQKQKCGAVVDSGSSHLGVPGPLFSDLRNLLSNIQTGNDTSNMDCRASRGPLMEIDFGSFSIKVSSKDYARPKPFLAAKTGRMTCKPNLMRVSMPPPLGPNLLVLGEPVLRRYYTVFDWAKKAIGFAEPKEELDAEEPEIVLLQVNAVVHRMA
jgi:saccharopepsin